LNEDRVGDGAGCVHDLVKRDEDEALAPKDCAPPLDGVGEPPHSVKGRQLPVGKRQRPGRHAAQRRAHGELVRPPPDRPNLRDDDLGRSRTISPDLELTSADLGGWIPRTVAGRG